MVGGTKLGWVTSADGTRIGYEAQGEGPVLIVVHGGSADRTRWRAAAPLIARERTVWSVDRRGRGLSGDASDYDIEQEAGDLVALVAAAEGRTVVLAHSYGATIALSAASRLRESALAGLVLYEPPLQTEGHRTLDDGTFEEVERLVEAQEPDQALTLFLGRLVGLPHEAIEALRRTSAWAPRVAAVHTLPREGYAARAFALADLAVGSLPFPVLVLRGTESPEWLRAAAAATHDAIPGSRLVELDGQAHLAMDTAPEAFARTVLEFCRECDAREPPE